ncbi:MAG: chromosome segregation SMC family protein [Sphaerochaetaceae bacterium]
MFLKSLELYGFKSFADKTRLEFSDGTTSLLGPNGCGKSNIVDAIKWVLGEQSTKTLRAGKMEDVIFNGTETRKPLNVAEVSLVISNSDGALPIDATEVEIRRRIFRSGESEFFINRNQVRLRDIRELFFDTGIGKSAYSILEQGKIDQILSHKPEDRRYIFEEAAGITRYKQRSVEAGRKLQRTEENIEQVETLFKEIKRQYDSRKIQAEKVERFRALEKEQSTLEVHVQLATIQNHLLLKEAKEQELSETQQSYDALKKESELLQQSLEQQQTDLRQFAEQRIELQSGIQRIEGQLNGKKDQLEILEERYRDFLRNKEEAEQRANNLKERLARNEQELEEQQDVLDSLDESIIDSEKKIHLQEKEMSFTVKQIDESDQQIIHNENSIVQEQHIQQELSGELQRITDLLVEELDEKLKASGYSTSQRKQSEKELTDHLDLIERTVIKQVEFSNELTTMLEQESITIQRAQTQWAHYLNEIQASHQKLRVLFETYQSKIPSFIDELLAPEGIISQKHSIDEKMRLSHQKVTSYHKEIAILKEERTRLQQLLEQYREHVVQLRLSLNSFTTKKESVLSLIQSLRQQQTESTYLLQDAVTESDYAQQRLKDAQTQIETAQEEQKQLLLDKQEQEESLSELILSIEQENERLGSERNRLNDYYETLREIRTTSDKITYHIEGIQQQIAQVYTNYFDTYGKSLKEFDDQLDTELEDFSTLREQLNKINKQIQGMGYINHMAAEEFKEIKERYDFIHQQLSDLQKAKTDLEKVIEEITIRSEKLFLESYQAIRVNFQQMFHRMFSGGRAELRLLDPENVLESGIDILAQPPGKKLDRLAPLSGGEKSLTAVALLFATYKVKPSPFAILDEIDAALDDRNIGNFLEVLDEFSQNSQFIIITHNKHTVLGSKTLLGITMEERGVSKTISYRMGLEDEELDNEIDNTV